MLETAGNQLILIWQLIIILHNYIISECIILSSIKLIFDKDLDEGKITHTCTHSNFTTQSYGRIYGHIYYLRFWVVVKNSNVEANTQFELGELSVPPKYPISTYASKTNYYGTIAGRVYVNNEGAMTLYTLMSQTKENGFYAQGVSIY